MMGEIEMLLDAVAKGDVEIIETALAENPEFVRLKGGYLGWTLLHEAAHRGQIAIAELLIDRGAPVHERDKGDNATPLHWAAGAGHLDVVVMLVTRGADVNDRNDLTGTGPIGWSTLGTYRPKVAEFLADAGAEIDFFPAIAMNRIDVVADIIEKQPAILESSLGAEMPYDRPLLFAVRRGRGKVVEMLLDAGADPNERSWLGLSPLAVAGFHGRTDIIPKLEARGARLDLGAAVSIQRWEEAKRLLRENHQQIHPGGDYERLFHFAAQEGDIAAVKFLASEGAELDSRIEWWPGHRVAPLHLASSNGHLDVVRELADRGADLLVEDSRYKSAPRGWAFEHKRHEVVSFLKDREPEY